MLLFSVLLRKSFFKGPLGGGGGGGGGIVAWQSKGGGMSYLAYIILLPRGAAKFQGPPKVSQVLCN